MTALSIFSKTSNYYRVDDLDALLEALCADGVE
jgi:hypothetical protein